MTSTTRTGAQTRHLTNSPRMLWSCILIFIAAFSPAPIHAQSADVATTQTAATEPPGVAEEFYKPEPVRLDGLSVGYVDGWEETAAGPFGTARRGDIVLRNDELALYFALPATYGEPKAEAAPDQTAGSIGRHPGALIDAMIGDSRVDFISGFTQAVGENPAEPNIFYDTFGFLRREANEETGAAPAIGVRFSGTTGGTPDAEGRRVATTWWLESGKSEILVASETDAGEPAQFVDIADWGAGAIISADRLSDPGGTGTATEVSWMAAKGGDEVIGYLVESGPTRAVFHGSTTRFFSPDASGEEAESDQPRPFRRRLFFDRGQFSSVTDRVFEHPSYGGETGRISGEVANLGEITEDDPWVELLAYDREQPDKGQWVLTRAPIDGAGKYSLVAPVGSYFIGVQSPARRFAVNQSAVSVQAGETAEKNIQALPTSALRVKVVDAETSEPLVARVQFAPLPPTQPREFHTISSPRGYLSNMYVDLDGGMVTLPAGKWAITASHGPRYDLGEIDVETNLGEVTEITVPLEKSSPTPDWQSLQVGALTEATTGSALTAEEAVLMAAGEDLDWIVSGDWETLTDLQPAVKELGLEGRIKTSLGFRTRLPLRPELGDFVIYPVQPGAPDPARARAEWAELTDTSEFIAAIRRLYPGALIEAETPFSETDGYFYLEGKNPYSMAYHMRDDVDPGIDAINVMPDREATNFRYAKDFFFVHTLRNRFYAPVPVSRVRVPLRSEPGYPRMLVMTGKDSVSNVTEDELFSALKAGRWQVTSGPFIEFTVEGQKPGALYASSDRVEGTLRVTAPDWIETATVDLTKEGMMSRRDGTAAAVAGQPERYDAPFNLVLYPQYKGDADTALSATVQGGELPEKVLPRYGAPGIAAEAFVSPILADTNKNDEWDPPLFREKGK